MFLSMSFCLMTSEAGALSLGALNFSLICDTSAVYFICGALVKIDTHDAGIGAAVCLFLAQAFFTCASFSSSYESWRKIFSADLRAGGWMAGVWCYSAEIIPLPWRSKGLGVAVAMQWIWST